MAWFVIFACTVFGLYFWREYRVQQQDLQSATSPLRAGERKRVAELEAEVTGLRLAIDSLERRLTGG